MLWSYFETLAYDHHVYGVEKAHLTLGRAHISGECPCSGEDSVPPVERQPFTGRLPAPLGSSKMTFTRLWCTIELSYTLSSATQSRG